MKALARRGFLKALLGVGAAAACGLKASETLAEPLAGTVPEMSVADAATEATEAALEPNQFFVVRRRRFVRRRRVFFVRPRRRVFLVRRRRFVRVRRFRRFR